MAPDKNEDIVGDGDPGPAPEGSSRAVIGALITVQVGFATLPVAAKLVLAELSPYGFGLIRLVAAGVFFSALATIRGKLDVPFRDVWRIALIGLLGTAVNQILYLNGLERSNATHAAVLVTLIPVFAFIIAIATRKERAVPLGLAGVGIAFAGVLSLTGVEDVSIGADTIIGDGLMVANAFSYSLYLVLSKPYVERYGAIPVVAISFVAASIVAAPFGISSLGVVPTMSRGALGALIYVVLVPTLLTYMLNAWALARASASKVAIYIYLQPLLGVLLAHWVLHEVLGPRALVSSAVVIFGIVLVNKARPTARIPKP